MSAVPTKFAQVLGAMQSALQAAAPVSPNVFRARARVVPQQMATAIVVRPAQAERDAGGVNKPCVLHKRNGEPWLVTIKAEDFLALLGGMDFSDL